MSEEQSKTGGTPVTTDDTTAIDSAPKPTPVMDIVPPPATASSSNEAPVVAAPPEEAEAVPVSDDLADQMAADSTTPPQPEPASVSSNDAEPEFFTPPAEESKATGAGDSPSDLIQEEINRDNAAPVAAVAKAPKVHNPVRTAVIVTIFLMIILAGLAVFAYLSSQK